MINDADAAGYAEMHFGAGTAGLTALREVKKRTANFVIVNDGPRGTICARVGSMPSKLLIEAGVARVPATEGMGRLYQCAGEDNAVALTSDLDRPMCNASENQQMVAAILEDLKLQE